MVDFVLPMMDFLSKVIDFVLKMMYFVLKVMDCALKVIDFVLKMMYFVLKRMDFASKMEGGALEKARKKPFILVRLSAFSSRSFDCEEDRTEAAELINQAPACLYFQRTPDPTR